MLEYHQQALIVESACRAFEGMALTFATTMASIESSLTAPHVVNRTKIRYVPIMKKWICEHDNNFSMTAVYGEGDTPAEAAASYDKAWRTGNNRLTPASSPEGSPSGAG